MYVLRHRLDADAVRAVRDAVVAEVQAEADRICEEVAAGDLGGRALETRKKQAADLRQKVLLYEDLLSVGLAGLHQAVDRADQAAATAALLLGAHGFAEPGPGRGRLTRPARPHPIPKGGAPCRPTATDPFAALEEAAARQAAEEQAARALAAARARLVLGRDARSAFFATLVLRLTPEPDWDAGHRWPRTAGSCAYHPPFVTGLSPDELVGVLAHEVMHCALAHPARRGGRDPERWNVACDLAVNPLLVPAGIVLPPARLMPGEGAYAGLAAGQVGRGVLRPPARPAGDAGGPAASPGRPADPGGCGRVDRPGRGRPGRGPAGRGRLAGGRRPGPAGRRRPRAACRPGSAGRSRPVLHPPADWRAVLREFVSAHARNDYSWARPNRRFIAQGLYLPGLHSEELGDVVLAVDTSGSIGEQAPGRLRRRGRTPSWPPSTARSPSSTTTPRCRRSRPGSRPTGRWCSTRSAAAGPATPACSTGSTGPAWTRPASSA